MAWFSLHFLSAALRQETNVNIVLPESEDGNGIAVRDLPVVYLLHGYTNNQNRWLLDTNVHYLAKRYGLAVVMPYGGNSFYTDTVSGGSFETYLMHELPAHLNAWFGISSETRRAYIAGNSMGAIGAMKFALTYPQRFKAAAAFSGPLDIGFVDLAKQLDPDEATAVMHDFPDRSEWTPGGANDPAAWLTRYKTALDKGEADPLAITVCCGTEDRLRPLSKAFVARARQIGISLDYHESPGEHSFLYWQLALEQWMAGIFADRLASN